MAPAVVRLTSRINEMINKQTKHGQHLKQSMDQPGMVANPALVVSSTGKKVNLSLSSFAPENLVSRDGLGRPIPRQPHSFSNSG